MRVDAEKSPFLADRLKIRILPTLVLIKDGKTDHSIIGFDEMGGRDDFAPSVLEQLLLKVRPRFSTLLAFDDTTFRECHRCTAHRDILTAQYDAVMESFC